MAANKKKKKATKKRKSTRSSASIKRRGATTKRRGRKRVASRRGKAPTLRGSLWRAGVVGALFLAAYVVHLDFTVREEMEGRRWALPATVYAQPLELYVGKPMNQDLLVQELERVGYQRTNDLSDPGSYTVRGQVIGVHTRAFRFPDEWAPSRVLKIAFDDGRIESVDDAPGDSVAIARIQPPQIGTISPTRREDRKLIQLDQVPEYLVGALLATEDRDFADHIGIDFSGLARALWVDIKAGRIVEGGSTITQQLVKNFFLTPERTIGRKLNEMIMAVLLELHYGKREILQTYLNEVYLGQSGNTAIHGFGLASLFYFGIPVSQLTLSQSATLVGMVKGPSYYNPRRHPERARERRNLVIGQLEEVGFIDAARADAARARPLDVIPKGRARATVYPAFVGLMKQQIQDEYRSEDLRTEGLRIFTTLDPQVQAIVEAATRKRLKQIEASRGMEPGTLNAAVVVAQVASGEVVAIAGGRRARFSGFNRAVEAARPVGSVIKPAVYLAALEASGRFTLATVIHDAPLTVEQDGAPDWSPENYSHRYYGDTLLIDALAHSLNVSTVRIGMAVGLHRVATMIHRLGVEQEIPEYPSMLLGAVPLSPVEVTQMYLTIANTGFRIPLRTTRSILSSSDKPLSRYPIEVEQVVEPDVVALLHYALQEVVRSGTAHALGQRFDASLGLAGKTGTTDHLRDSWFAGYSGNYVTVVWIGRDDDKSTGLTGSSGAMLLWADIMDKLHLTPTYPVKRGDVRFVQVDDQGRFAGGCADGRWLPFIQGTVPQRTAPCANRSAH